jgi:aminoglycoside phosphotransferase family enzyme/predicted kinase
VTVIVDAGVVAAQVRETDVNVVLLFGDRAYKLKKPVTTDLVDLGTPEQRLAACRREVELNRRLAPDVYLGISSVTDPVDPGADPGGAPAAEHFVVMRRMPEDRRLSHLVRSGAPVQGALRALARAVAVFHSAAPHDPEVTAEGSHDALLRRWAALVAEVRTTGVLAPHLVDPVERLAGRFLAGRAPLIAQRCAADRIVDGHGDLVADDVFCLDDGPRVLDCLEFDDRLRFVDGLDDAAFLAMDLERLGRPELATAWLDAYAGFSGDPAPAALRHHYVARRAFTQAKAACLRGAQGDPTAAADAAAHADLALRHLRSGAVRLVLVGGLPGTGKSTVAGGLADRVGAALLCGDRVWTELAGHDPHEYHHHDQAYGEGGATPARTDALYGELLHRAGALLERGESVVIDAAWINHRHREAAGALAARTHSELVVLRCAAPPGTARQRLATHERSISYATTAIAAAMAVDSEPWPQARSVDTSGSVARGVEQATVAWASSVRG